MQPKVIFKVGLPLALLICSNLCSYAEPAYQALPINGQVVAGQSSFSQRGTQLTINQGTQKAIINWQGYNIGAGAAVRYKQPDASSVSLNRVVSADPSQINGKLNANGQVWLINPHGVVFGKTAQVNVGGLAASTLNIKDENFLKGKKAEFSGDGKGQVVNSGRISAKRGGYVALLAPEVRNEGVIVAQQGTVAMAAGDKVTLDFKGDKLINMQVEANKIKALVENKQLIKADGGQVLMTASAADSLQTSVINNTGKIEASSMTNDGGVVRLSGAQTVLNSGEIAAKSNAGKGGRVELLGNHVGVMAHGKVDVSGKSGGGTILVGGDYQGKNPAIHNAQKTYIGQDAKLIADATGKGNGGKVIAWADDITRYHGSISAKGGKHSGNGGFAEVSGKRLLEFSGKADLSARKGKGGNLLLDPLNITLTNTADTNTAGFTPPGDLTEAFADDAGSTSNFDVTAGTGSFAGVTAGSTITLQATNDITVSNAFDIAAATGSANNSLVLQANNNINVNAAVTASGTGSINMTGDADNSGAGDLSLTAGLVTANSPINLSGFRVSSNSSGTLNSAGGAVTVASTGTSTLSGSILGTGTTFTKNGTGTITLTGANSYTGATQINAGTLISTNGRLPNTTAVNVGAAGTLSLNTSDIVGSLAGTGNVILNGTSTLSAGSDNTSTTFSGVMSGVGNFTKQGTGTMTLSGANTYTGNTTISAGTLVAGNSTALGATSGGTTITGGATLNINNVAVGAENVSIAGTGVGGSGALTGTGIASLAGNVTQTAASTISTTSAVSSLSLGGTYTGATATTLTGFGSITATNAANDFSTVTVTNAKDVSLRDANAITVGGGVSTLTGSLSVQAGANVTVANNVSTTGGDITLAGTNFINTAGASALSASGRWVVYANTHTGNTFGGLLSGNQAIWGTSFPATVAQTGNRYVFANSPTLTVASNNPSKTYGQDGAPTVANSYTATGFINALSFGNVFAQDTQANTMSGNATSTGSINTANVGSYTINLTPISASTGYTLNKLSTGTLTVNPAVISLSGTRSYDGTTAFDGGVFGTLSTGVLGETLNATGFGNVSSKNAGAAQTLATGSLALTNGTGLAANYTLIGGTHTGMITPVALSLSAASDAKAYDGTTTSSGVVTPSGLVSGDTINGLSQSFASKDVLGTNGSILNVNGGFTVNDGNGGGNYIASLNSASGTITPVALTLYANNLGKVYGQELVFDGNEFTSSGLIPGETIGRVDLASPGTDRLANVAQGPYAISLGNAAGGSFNPNNYAITYNNGNLTVDRAPLTLTANDARKFQGEPNPPFSGSYSGFVNGENSSVLNGALNFMTPAEPGSPIGFYFIRPFGVTADNYGISFIDGTLAVLAQVVPPPPPPTTPPGPNPNPGNDQNPLLAGAVTRPEQTLQTCLMTGTGNRVLNGMAYFGLDDIGYQASIVQPSVGGVVANALVRPSCYRL